MYNSDLPSFSRSSSKFTINDIVYSFLSLHTNYLQTQYLAVCVQHKVAGNTLVSLFVCDINMNLELLLIDPDADFVLETLSQIQNYGPVTRSSLIPYLQVFP